MGINQESAMFRMADMTKLLETGGSQSGHERNHLFYNVSGNEFVDLSGISGLDHPGDGRSFAILDFDRDGWQDIAFVNANRPLLQLMRNRMGETSKGAAIYLRFVGGNQTSSPARWSHRDGIGTRITVVLDDGRRLVREHQAGSGLAAQNSSVFHIGIGARQRVRDIMLRWPSGKVQHLGRIAAGSLVTVYENRDRSPSGQGFVVEPFAASRPRVLAEKKSPEPAQELVIAAQDAPGSRLKLYTTMAPWCAPCRAELPYFRTLDERFTSDELTFFGIPIDSEHAELQQWIEANVPPYEVLEVSEREAAAAQSVVQTALNSTSLPASIVTDSRGGVLLVRRGPPTVSQVRKLLAKTSTANSGAPEEPQ